VHGRLRAPATDFQRRRQPHLRVDDVGATVNRLAHSELIWLIHSPALTDCDTSYTLLIKQWSKYWDSSFTVKAGRKQQ